MKVAKQYAIAQGESPADVDAEPAGEADFEAGAEDAGAGEAAAGGGGGGGDVSDAEDHAEYHVSFCAAFNLLAFSNGVTWSGLNIIMLSRTPIK